VGAVYDVAKTPYKYKQMLVGWYSTLLAAKGTILAEYSPGFNNLDMNLAMEDLPASGLSYMLGRGFDEDGTRKGTLMVIKGI